jgi:hypothetical protein
MSKRIVLLMSFVLFVIMATTFALAQNKEGEGARGRLYDIKMMGLMHICIVDFESSKAHLYKESKDENGLERLELFKSIDLSKAGNDTIEYIVPANDAAKE